MAGLRVVVAVTPRLLGDVLCHALAQDGLDVISVDVGSMLLEEYDVAIVNGDRGSEVRARHVITLPEEDSGASGLSSWALLRHALAELG